MKEEIDYVIFGWLIPFLLQYGLVITILVAIYLIGRNLIQINVYV
jgi:hypothetical protein